MRVVSLRSEYAPRPPCRVHRLWLGPGGRSLVASIGDARPTAVVGYDLLADRPTFDVPGTLADDDEFTPPPVASADLAVSVVSHDAEGDPAGPTLTVRRAGDRKYISLIARRTIPGLGDLHAVELDPNGWTLYAAGTVAGSRRPGPGVWRFDLSIFWDGGAKLRPPVPLPDPGLGADGWESFTELVVSPSGRRAAAATLDGQVAVWDVGTRPKAVGCFRPDRAGKAARWPDKPVYVLAFGPDEEAVYASCSERIGRFTVGGEMVWAAKPPGSLGTLAVSPDGRTVLAAGGRPAVALLDAATGDPRQTFDWKVGSVGAVAFAPDGLTAAAGGTGGRAAAARVAVFDVG
jgi:WD40 repeat protein